MADPSAALWISTRTRIKNGERDESGFGAVVSPSTLYLRQVSGLRPPHWALRSSLALQFSGDRSVRGAGDETLGKWCVTIFLTPLKNLSCSEMEALGNEFFGSGVWHFAAVLFQLKRDLEFANFIVLLSDFLDHVEWWLGSRPLYKKSSPITTHLMWNLFLCYPAISSSPLNASGQTPFGLISQVTRRGTWTNLF